jgi:hypothetical protein
LSLLLYFWGRFAAFAVTEGTTKANRPRPCTTPHLCTRKFPQLPIVHIPNMGKINSIDIINCRLRYPSNSPQIIIRCTKLIRRILCISTSRILRITSNGRASRQFIISLPRILHIHRSWTLERSSVDRTIPQRVSLKHHQRPHIRAWEGPQGSQFHRIKRTTHLDLFAMFLSEWFSRAFRRIPTGPQNLTATAHEAVTAHIVPSYQ